MRKIKTKRAVSPVVTTVLLIAMVIIIAIIVLLWSRGFLKEKILKQIGGANKPIASVCNEVSLRTFANDDATFGFTNIGNVPIYGIQLKLTESGSGSTYTEGMVRKVNPGLSTTIETYPYTDYTNIEIVPILLGKTKGGVLREYNCSENGFRV